MVYQRYYIVFVIITGTCFSIISSNGLLIFCSILLIDYFKKTNILIGPNSIFKILYLFILRERGKEGEREWKKHQPMCERYINQLPPTHPLHDLACELRMCPAWELNWRPFDSQGTAQSTEPHQPGHSKGIFYCGKNIQHKIYYLKPFLSAQYRSVN